MNQKKYSELPDNINWVSAGESVPLMQGMALNALLKEYKGVKRAGWVLTHDEDEDDGDICLYVLDGVKIRNNAGEIVRHNAVAFIERGVSVDGWAIYWNDDKPEERKIYALTGKASDKCIMNGNTWKESEVKS